MSKILDKLFSLAPYSLAQEVKDAFFLEELQSLTFLHGDKCDEYSKILAAHGHKRNLISSISELPMLPVRLFKKYELRSVGSINVIKKMTSSGTTGQQVSNIFIDSETSTLQTKVLVKIVSSFIGSNRVPLLIVDTPEITKDRKQFSARAAGILGFSMFGREVQYALNDRFEVDIDLVSSFLLKNNDKQILVFGFTSIIWESLYKALSQRKISLTHPNAVLIHGGGWKKLIKESVDNMQFKASLRKILNFSQIHDYYGMVEQTGSIFMECEEGYLHASIFSDIYVRRNDLSLANKHELGLVQLVSLLPRSYPGHNLLTEDLGEICGVDDCKCGRLGKYFKIHGRVSGSEIRGCSNV